MSVNKQNKEDVILKAQRELCKGCRICVEFCPKGILSIGEDNKILINDIENCIKCGLCEMRCPDYAIYLGGINDEQ